RAEFRSDIENLLTPGRYFVHAGVNRVDGSGVALYAHNALDFVVYGREPGSRGLVNLPFEASATIESGARR
ncbi:MAG TPA: hypothetical protein VHF50_02345, partial [Solirubrobacterales bacterium]|nr:hypothetical protein [Solirubrobacterales bacterium]